MHLGRLTLLDQRSDLGTSGRFRSIDLAHANSIKPVEPDTTMKRPLAKHEVHARAINAEPWQPMRGMVKRRCERCAYWFATPRHRPAACCPDCELVAVDDTQNSRR